MNWDNEPTGNEKPCKQCVEKDKELSKSRRACQDLYESRESVQMSQRLSLNTLKAQLAEKDKEIEDLNQRIDQLTDSSTRDDIKVSEMSVEIKRLEESLAEKDEKISILQLENCKGASVLAEKDKEIEEACSKGFEHGRDGSLHEIKRRGNIVFELVKKWVLPDDPTGWNACDDFSEEARAYCLKHHGIEISIDEDK